MPTIFCQPQTRDVAIQVNGEWDRRSRARRRIFEDMRHIGHLRPVPPIGPEVQDAPKDITLRISLKRQRRLCDCAGCVRHATRLLTTSWSADTRDTGVALCDVAWPASTEQHCHRPWLDRQRTSAAGREDGGLQLFRLHGTQQLRRSVDRGSAALRSRKTASTATATPRRRRMSQTTVVVRLTCAVLPQLQPQPELMTE